MRRIISVIALCCVSVFRMASGKRRLRVSRTPRKSEVPARKSQSQMRSAPRAYANAVAKDTASVWYAVTLSAVSSRLAPPKKGSAPSSAQSLTALERRNSPRNSRPLKRSISRSTEGGSAFAWDKRMRRPITIGSVVSASSSGVGIQNSATRRASPAAPSPAFELSAQRSGVDNWIFV